LNERVRLRSYTPVLVKAISLPRENCVHVSSNVSPYRWTWVRLVVTVQIDGTPGYGEEVTIQIDDRPVYG